MMRRAQLGELKNTSIRNLLNREFADQTGAPTVDELLEAYYKNKDPDQRHIRLKGDALKSGKSPKKGKKNKNQKNIQLPGMYHLMKSDDDQVLIDHVPKDYVDVSSLRSTKNSFRVGNKSKKKRRNSKSAVTESSKMKKKKGKKASKETSKRSKNKKGDSKANSSRSPKKSKSSKKSMRGKSPKSPKSPDSKKSRFASSRRGSKHTSAAEDTFNSLNPQPLMTQEDSIVEDSKLKKSIFSPRRSKSPGKNLKTEQSKVSKKKSKKNKKDKVKTEQSQPRTSSPEQEIQKKQFLPYNNDVQNDYLDRSPKEIVPALQGEDEERVELINRSGLEDGQEEHQREVSEASSDHEDDVILEKPPQPLEIQISSSEEEVQLEQGVSDKIIQPKAPTPVSSVAESSSPVEDSSIEEDPEPKELEKEDIIEEEIQSNSDSGDGEEEFDDNMGFDFSNGVQVKHDYKEGVIKVFLVWAKNLVGRNSRSLPDEGVSNPYCLFHCPGGRIRKSKTIKDTVHPVWNEEMNIPVTLDKENLENFRAFVYDTKCDITSIQDAVGYVDFNIDWLASNPGKWMNTVMDLRVMLQMSRALSSRSTLGKLYAQVVWIPKGSKPKKRPKLIEDMASRLKKKIPISGTLVVVVNHAKNLPGFDRARDGSRTLNDAYVEIIFPKDQVLKTKIKSETNTPIWNERFVHKLTIRGDNLDPLRFVVWDKDEKSSDDIIGFVDFDLLDVYSTPNKWSINGSFPLHNVPGAFGFHNFGELAVEVKFIPGSKGDDENDIPHLDYDIEEQLQQFEVNGTLYVDFKAFSLEGLSLPWMETYWGVSFPDGSIAKTKSRKNLIAGELKELIINRIFMASKVRYLQGIIELLIIVLQLRLFISQIG